MRSTLRAGWLCLALLAFSGTANATVVYSYVGNDLTNFSNITEPCTPLATGCAIRNITAEIVVDTALAADAAFSAVTATSWWISDGLTTITDSTAGFNFTFALSAGTDSLGDIDEWWFQLVAASPVTAVGQLSQIRTRNFGGTIDDQTDYCQSYSGGCTFTGIANAVGDPGVWTTTLVPLPAAAWLFLSGLVVLGRFRRDRSA